MILACRTEPNKVQSEFIVGVNERKSNLINEWMNELKRKEERLG